MTDSRTRQQQRLSNTCARKLSVTILLSAVWFGLLAGLAEVVIQLLRRLVFLQTIDQGNHVIWMAPLANGGLFLVAALMLLPITRLITQPSRLRVAVFALASLSSFSLAFLFHPQLHKYAGVLLAVGLGLQVSKVIAAHAQGFDLLLRRSLGWIGGLVLLLGVGLYIWQGMAERQNEAELAPARPDAPNVIFIVLDTVRARNMSLYGYERATTPELERLASGGVSFERAISTAPWTLPSHASMFTGRYPHELSGSWTKPLDSAYPTLAEVLRSQGYRTAGFVANTGYASYEFGLNRGFIHYEDYTVSLGRIILSSSLGRFITSSRWLRRVVGYHQTLGRKTAEEVNKAFLSWLSRQVGRPFFSFLNYYDAHGPYVPPSPFGARFDFDRPTEWNPLAHKKDVPDQELRSMIDGYDGSIAYLDHQLGLLFDELRNRKILENTLVVITSDHGEEFGEHGIFDHGNTLYLPSVHVPLLILFPQRVPEKRTVEEPVTLRDLPSTVIGLLRLEREISFPGNSLSRHWSDAQASANSSPSALLSEVDQAKNVPVWIPAGKGDMESLWIGDLRYIRNGDGREELYNLASDPLEEYDQSDSKEGRQTIEQFRRHLEVNLGSHLNESVSARKREWRRHE